MRTQPTIRTIEVPPLIWALLIPKATYYGGARDTTQDIGNVCDLSLLTVPIYKDK